jgi:hypothetical protein
MPDTVICVRNPATATPLAETLLAETFRAETLAGPTGYPNEQMISTVAENIKIVSAAFTKQR